MADTPDVETMKRKGRRRLVGAIALVLLAVIVLPMVFDNEPKRLPPVSVRIPSEDDPSFTPKVLPKGPPVEAPKAEAAPAPRGEGQAPSAKTETPLAKPEPPASKPEPSALKPEAPVAKPELKAEPQSEARSAPPAASSMDAKADRKPKPESASDEERKRAEAAIAGTTPEQFVVPVGAFASAEKVQEVLDKLKAEGLPGFTELVTTSKGERTRVRAGPFLSRAAADKASARLKEAGLSPGKVLRRR